MFGLVAYLALLCHSHYPGISQIGPGLTFGLVVTGQMILSAILEHFDIMVAQTHPISLMRILGIALVIAGVIIVRND